MPTRTLLGLDEDILYLILLQLSTTSPTSVCTFSRVSKTSHKLANPIIWRTIRIGEEYSHYYHTVDFARPAKRPFLGRAGVEMLLSKTHLLELVREIVVQDFESIQRSSTTKTAWVTDSEMAKMISYTKMLSRFCWNSETAIGQKSIAALERKSDLELHVTRHTDIYLTDPLDVPLLSSSLLRTLTHNISWRRSTLFDEESDNDMLYSQLEEMDSILSRSKSIKILDFRLNILNSISRISTATMVDLKAVEYIPDKTFDNILSLDIPADYGNANRSPSAHRVLTSLLISRVHKWRSVQELHLGGLHAPYTFQHLKDRVPNLKKLELMLPAAWSNRGELSPTLVAQFLLTLENLEELKIRDMDQGNVDVVWPAIVEKKHTLRSLDMYTSANLALEAPVWEARHFDEILINSTITHLALNVSIATLVTWSLPSPFSPGVVNPKLPTTITTLRTLKLTSHIPLDQASIFSEQYNYDIMGGTVSVPSLDSEKAKEVAVGIFNSLGLLRGGLGNGGNLNGLEELELCLVRLAVYDRAQTEEMKTSIFVRGVGGVGVLVDVREKGGWS